MTRYLVVIDFETTGLTPHRDFPVQVGVVVLDRETGHPVKSFESGINVPLTSAAVLLRRDFWNAKRIHRRSLKSMFVEGVSPHRVVDGMEALRETFPDAILAGHNVAFDAAFLKRLYELTGTPYKWSHRTVDLSTLGFAIIGEQKLHKIARRLNVPLEDERAHDALYDATVTAYCLRELLKLAECALPSGAQT